MHKYTATWWSLFFLLRETRSLSWWQHTDPATWVVSERWLEMLVTFWNTNGRHVLACLLWGVFFTRVIQGPSTTTWINHTSSKAEFWKLKNIYEKPDSPYCLNHILGNMFTMPFLMGEFTSMIVKHTDLVGRMPRIQQHNVTGNRPMVPGLGIHFTPTGFAVHILRGD